jgi:hypothetical protein
LSVCGPGWISAFARRGMISFTEAPAPDRHFDQEGFFEPLRRSGDDLPCGRTTQ